MKLNYLSAVITYVILIVGLYFLIIRDKEPVWKAILLGGVIYGTYEYTNKATISNWDWSFTVVDTLWGATCFGLTTFIYYWLKDNNLI